MGQLAYSISVKDHKYICEKSTCSNMLLHVTTGRASYINQDICFKHNLFSHTAIFPFRKILSDVIILWFKSPCIFLMTWRRKLRIHETVFTNVSTMESVNSSRSWVCISQICPGPQHIDTIMKKAHQHLFCLRRLKRLGISANILFHSCRCMEVGIFPGGIMA